VKGYVVIGVLFLVTFDGCVSSYAEGTETSCSPAPDDGNAKAAGALFYQLRSAKPEDREKAAAALQAMGTNATKVLADKINHKPFGDDDALVLTKAVTILGKMGTDIANDSCVRTALLNSANGVGLQWPVLGLRIAAIDALGEINKYRGGILAAYEESADDKFDLSKAIGGSDELAKIAEQVFASAQPRSEPPTATPPDTGFYKNLKELQDTQSNLVKLAAQVNAAAPSSKKKKKSAFPKLTDGKTLAASLRKIEIGYSDATKAIDVQKLKLENASDKSRWQFQTEASYDLLSEVTELKNQLDALAKGAASFRKNREALKSLVSELATTSQKSNSWQIKTSVASALNEIFAKPPDEKPAEETTKKESTKNNSDESGADKSGGEKKDTAKINADKESKNDE
jgi:hypothetical protein